MRRLTLLRIPPAQSPQDGVYHWNFNAESYVRIDYGMAEAMKELLAVEGCRDAD